MSENTKELLKKFDIKLTKSLGQNFLIDSNIVRKIVESAGVTDDHCVIEVGPGIGAMTVELAKKADRVIAIEIDKKLIPALLCNLNQFSNVEILNEDIMKVDIEKILENLDDGCIKVVANLPYYITTPIIMKLLESESKIDSMVFMVQKEVAQRMVAAPGGKDYGALSIAVQYYSEPKIMFSVSPNCFIPKPDVESSVVRLMIKREHQYKINDKEAFFKTVKAAFGQRRKTLVNALANSGYFLKNKEEIKKILLSMGLREDQRGETLTIEQFAYLSNIL